MWMPSFKRMEVCYEISYITLCHKNKQKYHQPHIPYTDSVDPLTLICDDAQIAEWNNEGLPMDQMSTENATILTNSTRWPLMIDPQL